MTTIMVVLMTKLIICSLKKCCKKHACCCYIAQISTVVAVLIVAITGLVLIHTFVYESKVNTPLGLVGYSLEYIAILLTFSITMLTPWYHLITPDVTLRTMLTPWYHLITPNESLFRQSEANNTGSTQGALPTESTPTESTPTESTPTESTHVVNDNICSAIELTPLVAKSK